MKSLSTTVVILGLAGASAVALAGVPASLTGDVVPTDEASTTIAIGPATRYVNVMHGDAVKFVVNGRTFAFRFDGAPSAQAIDLQTVAPAGLLDHRVIAYVGTNVDEYGGTGGDQ
jgi:hypothetical protein